jgi:hypothetical protein
MFSQQVLPAGTKSVDSEQLFPTILLMPFCATVSAAGKGNDSALIVTAALCSFDRHCGGWQLVRRIHSRIASKDNGRT